MTQVKDLNDKLYAWHSQLIGEANTLAFRLRPDVDVTKVFFDDLAFSLERLAERVRREQKVYYPDAE